MARAVDLAAGPRQVVVVDMGGGPEACRRLFDCALIALPLAEEEAGFPLPGDLPVAILVFSDPSKSGGYEGVNDNGEIRVQASISDRALVHELAHGWFSAGFVRDSRGGERWIIEGLCEHLSVDVLRRAPALGDAAAAHASILAGWTSGHGGPEPLLARDAPSYPLATGARSAAAAGDWYARAYACYHLLYCRLGAEPLRRVHARIAATGGHVTSGRYVAELARIDPCAPALLAGWQVPGAFAPGMHPDLCRDSDGDLASDAEEAVRCTAPLLKDARGAPPRYAIDGDVHDWLDDRPSARYRYDPGGDLENGAPSSADVRAVWIDADASYVYALFRLESPPAAGDSLELAFDADGDDVFDALLAVSPALTVSTLSLYETREDSDSHESLSALRAATRGDVEVALPRAALSRGGVPLAGDLRVYAYSLHMGDGKTWTYADQLRGWIPFTLP
jgi:hypothetical protein